MISFMTIVYLVTFYYFQKIKHESGFFLIIFSLVFIWLGLISVFDIFSLNSEKIIPIFISSITASLAPLGFYIAYKNYHRKSGVQLQSFINVFQPISTNTYDTFINQIIIENLKDRAYGFKTIKILLNSEYLIDITPDTFPESVKAYDILKCSHEPFSYYKDKNGDLIELQSMTNSHCSYQLILTTINNTQLTSNIVSNNNAKSIFFDEFKEDMLKLDEYCSITAFIASCRVPVPKDVSRPLNIDCCTFIIDKQYRKSFFILGFQLDQYKKVTQTYLFNRGFLKIIPSDFHNTHITQKLIGKTIRNEADLRCFRDDIYATLQQYEFYKYSPDTYELINYYPSSTLSRHDIKQL